MEHEALGRRKIERRALLWGKAEKWGTLCASVFCELCTSAEARALSFSVLELRVVSFVFASQGYVWQKPCLNLSIVAPLSRVYSFRAQNALLKSKITISWALPGLAALANLLMFCF